MEFNSDIRIAVISTIIGALAVEAIIWIITKIYRKFSPRIKKFNRVKRLERLEQNSRKTKKYKIALRMKETKLIYQHGIVRCSKQRIDGVRIKGLVKGFPQRYLLKDLFEENELLEYSEEVSYDCWKESEFDFIIDV